MPWKRGSASIGKMLEGSIYGSFGLNISYNPKKQVDLESLSSPNISTFIQAYEDSIELTPMQVVD